MIKDLRKLIQKKEKTHLIFDFDRTIAYLDMDWSGWHEGVAKIFQEFDPGYEPHPHQEHLFVNDVVKKYGTPVAQKVEKFSRAYERDNLRRLKPNRKLIAFIQGLYLTNQKQEDEKKQYHFYVYTSNTRPTIERALEELKLAHLFKKVVSKSEVKLIKPHPEGFYLLYDEGVDKSQYLMVGDSETDQGVAQRAGIDFIKVDPIEEW